MKSPRALLAALVFAAGASAAEPPSPAVLRDLAPSGKLRVTFIVSNPVQVTRDASGFRGPAIDLGRELAKRLGVPFEPLGHPRAADIVASAKTGAWDLAFLAFDPERADAVDFSPAYVEAHNANLAPAGPMPESLKAFERRVLQLLAYGLTNAQIARSLVSSAAITAPMAMTETRLK